MFNPRPPFIATPSATSNPNASNPLSAPTQIALQNRPNATSVRSDTASPEDWDAQIATIQAMMQASSGWEQKKLQAQMEDAEKGRANAYKIAQLSASTSRYGTDAAKETAMAQLKQRAHEFEQTHALDIAKTATEYLSTPDRFFQASDFLSMTNRAAQGQGPAPYGANGSPTPKTMADWNTLYTGGGSPAGSPAPVPSGGKTSIYSGGGGGGSAAPAAVTDGGGSGGGGGATAQQQNDPRMGAVQAVFKAMPPSEGGGMDDTDYAALTAAKAIYESPLRPGTLERMRPGQQAMLASAGKRLGYHVPDWQAQYNRNKPGQKSVRLA
jgi:hypothetical protein